MEYEIDTICGRMQIEYELVQLHTRFCVADHMNVCVIVDVCVLQFAVTYAITIVCKIINSAKLCLIITTCG